jgi:hypothetical protein
MHATKESDTSVIKRLRIKKSQEMWATKESEFIDHDKLRLEKFKAVNVYGHSSDSTVQKLLGKFVSCTLVDSVVDDIVALGRICGRI